MKKDFTRGELTGGQLDAVTKAQQKPETLAEYYGLLAVLADVVDTAVAGADCYASFGVSRDRTAVLLTITYGGRKLYASGTSLVEVARAAESLLE